MTFSRLLQPSCSTLLVAPRSPPPCYPLVGKSRVPPCSISGPHLCPEDREESIGSVQPSNTASTPKIAPGFPVMNTESKPSTQRHNDGSIWTLVSRPSGSAESSGAGQVPIERIRAVNAVVTPSSPSPSSAKSPDTASAASIFSSIQPKRNGSDESVPTTVTISSSSTNSKGQSASLSQGSLSTSATSTEQTTQPSNNGTTITSTTSGRSKGSSRESKLSDSASQQPPPRIVYGPGAIEQLPIELARLDLSCPVIISSPSRVPLARRVQALISGLDSRILDSAVVQVPTRVIDDAVGRISGRDCVISVGGDSAVGLARAIGMRKKIPHICIPTTYSGAEPGLLGGSQNDKKYGNNRDSKGLISIVIYDEDLTRSSPKRFSASSVEILHDTIMEDADSDVSLNKNGRGEDAQWSFLNLPGI